MNGWAFHLGELVLVASAPDVNEELRGEIVEIAGMPVTTQMKNGSDCAAYQVEHHTGRYWATEGALRKLPPPGTRPCDQTYDGLYKSAVTWEALMESLKGS